MAQQLLMPKLGLTMTEGTVVEWSVEEGAVFDAGTTVVVVETDKVANEIEAPAAGRMTRVLVPVSETVPVGTVLAEWELLEEAPSAAAVPKIERAPAIVAASRSALSPAEAAAARKMTESKQSIPHFYLSRAIDVTLLAARRADWNARRPASKATLTHLLLFAIASALKANHDLNRVWVSGSEVALLQDIDVGLAIQTPAGLRAPMVRSASEMDLEQLIKVVNDLKERAIAGRLTSEDNGGGAITLSNAGTFGVDAVTPIINPGQSMILGVGRVRPILRIDENGRAVPGKEITATLSCDHRVLDGNSGARLLRAIREMLETSDAICSLLG